MGWYPGYPASSLPTPLVIYCDKCWMTVLHLDVLDSNMCKAADVYLQHISNESVIVDLYLASWAMFVCSLQKNLLPIVSLPTSNDNHQRTPSAPALQMPRPFQDHHSQQNSLANWRHEGATLLCPGGSNETVAGGLAWSMHVIGWMA